MKPIVIYAEKESTTHKNTIKNVKAMLCNLEFSVYCASEVKEEHFLGKDLVISIGGDGTFLKAASFIRDNTPIVGINSEPGESEGALTSICYNELVFLDEIIKGNFKTIMRERIETELNNKLLKEIALNEVYVGALTQFHASRYRIKFKNKEEEQRSSGVVIASGSGSCAWYKSAGGKPFSHDESKIKFIVREPYMGDRLFKPKILNGELQAGDFIELKSERTDGGVIAIDATTIHEFNKGAVVKVRLSDKPLRVIVK